MCWTSPKKPGHRFPCKIETGIVENLNTDALPVSVFCPNSRYHPAISLLGLFLALLQKALDGRSLERSNRVKKGLISDLGVGNTVGKQSPENRKASNALLTS
jgi:hypothetical protein